MNRNLPPWVLILIDAIAILSTVLSQLTTVRDSLPVPAVVFWFLIVALVLCASIWMLATAKRDESLVGVPARPKYRLRWALLNCILAVLVLLASGALVGQSIYPRTSIASVSNQLPSSESEGCTHSSSLQELYACLNTSVLDAAVPYGDRLVLVTGGAGAGKSFLRRILKANYDKALTIRLCSSKPGSSEHLCADCEGIKYEARAELIYGEDGGHSFNSMSHIAELNNETFFGKFEESGLVLIDDLDEVHPDSATRLLNALADQVGKSDTRASVVVFGRPEAFVAFFLQRFGDRSVSLRAPSVLNAPNYDSASEVRLLVSDWAASATPKRDQAAVEKIAPALYDYAKSRLWVRQSLRILTLGNFLCERFEEKTNWNDSDLKERIVAELFNRAFRSHGRPQYANELYKPLFSQVALKFAPKVESSGELSGYFPVGDEIVTVQDSERSRGTVPVRRLLSLSGIAYLKPSYWQQQYWAFEPLWVHEYLLQQENEKTKPHYWTALMAVWICLLIAPVVVFGWAWRIRSNRFPGNVSW